MSRREAPLAARLSGLGAVLGICLAIFGCGSSEPDAEAARQEREAVHEVQQRREDREMARQLRTGDFVGCGRQLFVTSRSLCAYARNVQNVYYAEVVAGAGTVTAFYPAAHRDYRVRCTGSTPHRCSGYEDGGKDEEIESLGAGLIFFSP
jgi:hypothetical protein